MRRRAQPISAITIAIASATVIAILGAPAVVRAGPPQVFGAGPRIEALARSAVSDGAPSDAGFENPAAAAAAGAYVRVGAAYSGLFLRVNGADARVAPQAGFDIGTHAGRRFGQKAWVGAAMGLHVPDTELAQIGFRPATEPQFVLYETSIQRLTFDAVAAFRYGPLAVGGGAAVALDVGGPGVAIHVTQDATGARVDGSASIGLTYRFAPLVGATLHLGRLGVGAMFRGETAVDLTLASEATIDLAGNPLNGATRVLVTGTSGYDPARIAIGGRWLIASGLRAFAALEYATYSAAPAPVANVGIDLHLAVNPTEREVKFVSPRWRDTLSPRFGLEFKYPALPAPAEVFGDPPPGADPWRWAVRAGYMVAPSPVPPQTGFTSYADATRHAITFGGAVRIGEIFGVDFSLAGAIGVHVLERRTEIKESAALPFARYEVAGEIVRGSMAIEGRVP